MIHEITPKKMWNSYEARVAEKNSIVICVYEDTYCIIHEANEDRFPHYHEIEDLPAQSLQYLFAIKEEHERTDYFLCVCEKEPHLKEALTYTWEVSRYMNHGMRAKEQALAGMTAHHLYVWYRDNQYCGRCGQAMKHDEKERMMRCPKCGNMVFPKIAPAVLAIVQKQGKMLLTKYANGDGNYALVAGFVEIGETAEECVVREVLEETGLHVKNVRYYDSQPWGFAGNLMLAYTAEPIDETEEICRDASELAAAEWVAPEEIPPMPEQNSLTREIIRRFREGQF